MPQKNFFSGLPSRLSRITTGGKLIREIDGLRFAAIFPVIVQHISERLTRYSTVDFNQGLDYDFTYYLTNRGFIGVYVFFVLSGFILGMPFASHYMHGTRRVSLRSYFLRRITRLEPPYIIVMTSITVALIAMGTYSLKEIFPHFMASIFYLHSLIYQSWTYINPPAWSLEVEVQFYILAPFLALGFFKIRHKLIRRTAFVSVIILMLVSQQFMSGFIDFARLTILAHIHYFVIGFLLVDIYLNEWKEKITRRRIFDYLSILSILGAVVVWSWDHQFINRLGFSICLFMFVFSVFQATWVNRLITMPWITAIGGMCYTIYLIHLPIVEFLIKITRHVVVTDSLTINFLLQFLILAPIILVFSIAFFLAVEKPCMDKDWPKQLRNYLMSKLGILSTR